jgi:predicted nucleic acid-binding protein
VIHALLDTSIVIASADALTLESEDTAAISVLTIGELQAGVRLAREPAVRALRQSRLNAVRAMFEPLLVDETIALHYGDLLAVARSQGRTSKATDLLILATASATGRTLLTLDDAQASLARVAGVAVNPL